MQNDKKNSTLILIIVALVIVIVVMIFALYSKKDQVIPEEALVYSEGKVAPELELTDAEKSGEFDGKKSEILTKVRSTKLLTEAEKVEITGIMFAKAHLYGFTDEEREDIFAALRDEK